MLEKTERARMDNQETYEILNTSHRTWPNKAELQKATAQKKKKKKQRVNPRYPRRVCTIVITKHL